VSENVFPTIKNAASFAAQSSAFKGFLRLLENVDSQKPGFLRVLTYHRVDDPAKRPWLDPGLISATPNDFDEQMAYLAAHYQVITVSDLLAAVQSQNRKDLPPRTVLVTFDDGYQDFEEQAWPVLKRHKIPATLFVPTAYPDRPQQTFWWDDLYHALQSTTRKDSLHTSIGVFPLSNDQDRKQAYQRLKNHMKMLKHVEARATVNKLYNEVGVRPAANCIMSWETLRKLNREGLTLGAHTRTHPLMNRISLAQAREEAVGSLQDLRREIGFALPIFAYPSGEFNNEVVNMLEHEGFALAFTTTRGINDINHTDPLRIQRINVGGRTTLPILRAQLLSWTAYFSRLQARVKA
jgi:peptidoglycan/xylan/chitin deacetylase (PgdA/CDA1 family)